MNVWSLIKDAVGKGELSRVQTPVQFLEPLSELQQRCEDMEFSELLDQVSHLKTTQTFMWHRAASLPDPGRAFSGSGSVQLTSELFNIIAWCQAYIHVLVGKYLWHEKIKALAGLLLPRACYHACTPCY